MGVYGNGDYKSKSKKPSRSTGALGESYDAVFVGYINLQLTDDQKSNFDSWVASASPNEALDAFTGDGVNFSLKFEPKSGGFLASATQRRVGSPNAGLCVTARASAAELAFWRVVYCVTILSHAEKWTDLQPVASPDRW